MKYTYHINLDERGSFYADVRDGDENTIYDVKLGDNSKDYDFDLIDAGYMTHCRDVKGLSSYLEGMGIIEEGSTIKLA